MTKMIVSLINGNVMECNRMTKYLVYTIVFFVIHISALDTSKFTRFQRISDRRYTSGLGSWHATCKDECLFFCTRTTACLTASFNRKSQQCDLGSATLGTHQMSASQEWEFFFNAEIFSCLFDSCYVLVRETATWEDANNYCQLHFSGHLAHVKTEIEMSHITSSLQIDRRAWLGATDMVTEGLWVWTDSTPLMNGYTKWMETQPDNASSHGGEDCLVLTMGNFEWNDLNCTSVRLYSICQYSTKLPV